MDGRKSDDATTEGQQLGFVAGVIGRERVLGFERMLWRVSRGNVFLRQADIEKPFTDPKTVRLLRNEYFSMTLNSIISGQGDLQERLRRFLSRRTTEDACQEGLLRLPCEFVSVPG